MMKNSENSSDSDHANHHAMIKSTETVPLGAAQQMRSDISSWGNYAYSRRPFHSRRRRKLPTVRLGGRGRWGFFLKRVKMRSLKLKVRGMIKKIKSYCRNLAKDIFEAGGNMDSIMQDAIVFETAFAIPVMTLSFNSLPGRRQPQPYMA